MVKRVFAIIGIVLGSALVFAGAVIGVYALMGRFRTPVVYPSRLEFVESEQTIVNDNQNGLYYFILNGYSNSENEVNKKNCFIDVLDGTDLIQLCSSNGENLTEYVDENGNRYPNRYLVQCNERIYYKLKNIGASHFNDSTYGRILIQARDEQGQHQSNQLTIWVDRKIDEILIGEYNGENPIIVGEITNEANETIQTIPIGLEVSQYFNILVEPNYSLRPISSQEEKIVEIYYFDSNEYVLIDNDNITDYNFLHLDQDTNQMYFETADAGSYTFKIAVFDTYASREAYLSDESNLTDSNFERINNMVNTTVVFNVVNSDIEEVGFDSSGISFNLYDESSMTLSSLDDATPNNLGLYMLQNDRETFSRFNEVDFTMDSNFQTDRITLESTDGTYSIVLTNDGITQQAVLEGFDEFVSPDNVFSYQILESDSNYVLEIYGDNPTDVILTLSIEMSNIALERSVDGDVEKLDKILINKFTCEYNLATIEFMASSGVTFLDIDESITNLTNLTLLKTGSYLEFYIYDYDTQKYYKFDNIEYSVTSVGSGREKTFNIIMQNNPIPSLATSENLVLGILVVNANGESYFDFVDVNIQELALDPEFVNGDEITLNVDYVSAGEDNFVPVYDSMNFDEIVNIVEGTYDACVFVTPYSAEGNYDVEVLEGVTFIDRTGNKYVLVGTFEGGSYQNVVKVRKGATNTDTTLYFIQLRNQYNQTAEEYINNIIYNENVFAKYSFSLESNNPDGETTNTNATLNVKYSIDEENNVLVSANLVDVQDIQDITVVSAEIEEGLLVVELSNDQTVSEFNLVNFFIETESEQGSTQEEVVLANKTNSSGLADVVDDAVSTSREVSVSVSYSIIKSEIQFNYNERNEIGGDNNIVIDNQERVNIVENTTSHVISLSAPNVQDMIKNMFNADFDSSNLSVRLYSDNGSLLSDNFQKGLLLGDISLSEDESALIINYDVSGSLSNPDYYLRLCLTYNGKMIESAPIYIISTAPTDIDLVYTTTGSDGVVTNNEIDLSDNPSGAENSPNYINIEVSYDVETNEYVYKYYLITEENRARILIDSTFFNATSDNNTTNGFKVRSIISDIFNPEYLPNITHNLDYTSLNSNVISFNDEGAISINSVGVVTIMIGSDSQSAKYLRIVVVTDGKFSLNNKNSQISSNSCNLNESINYTYDGTDISSNSHVNIESLEYTYFGGGRKLEVIENENGFTIQTETTNPDDTAEIVLQVVKFPTGWTFTRERFQTANLNIRFNVVTPTGSLERVTIKFTSSITINQNNSWSNYYQGTSALLFEMSGNNTFSNNSIFRINSTTPTAGISINVTDPDNQPVNLTSSSTEANAIEDVITFEKLGNYVVSFVLDDAEIESRTITVIPNILLSANLKTETGEDLKIVSDSTYNLSDFVTISQYNTTEVYGKGTGEVYLDSDLVEPEDYSTVFGENISMTSNLTTNSLFTLNEEDFKIFTGWIQEIGSSLNETLTFNYGTYNLGSIDVTISNKYTYSLKKETTYMAETVINFANPTNTNPTGESETIELQSVEYLTPDEVPQIDVNYDISTQMFRFSTTTGHIEQLNNVILRFTFSVGDEILIYQTTTEDEITISPYVPNELNDIITAYSNGEYDLLRNIYDIDNINDIVSRFIVTKVSDDSAFKSTDFLGGGYDKGSETQTGLLVDLAEIVGSTKVVTITYQIKYEIPLSEGSTQSYTYTFTRDFEIQNRQSVSIQYPFGDGFVDSNASGTNLHFANELDGSNNGTFVSSTSQYNQYSVKNFKFEPVMINQTIDFDYDEIMNVSRVQVVNAVPDTIDDDVDFEISIAGWSPRSNINNYINNGNIDIDNVNKTITFNPSSTFTSGSYGYIVFRIESTSGYLAYYYVQLYNQTGGNNNYATADSTTVVTSEASCGKSFVDNGAVLGKSLISTSTNLANLEFTSADFSRLEFYLLSAEMLDGSDFFNETNPNRYSKLDNTQLTDLNNYTNIKIGVVMRVSTFSILNLGVLNFYVQPIYEEVLSDTNLQHQTTITNPDDESTPISNGEYTRVITINEDEVVVPFEGVQMRRLEGNIASDPTSVEIISVNSSSDFTLDTNTNSIKNGEDVVVQIEESTIKLSKYVRNENLEFSVKYTYTIGEGETASEFVLIVHYTYNQLEINNNAVTINNIGAFDNTKFNNRVNLNEIVGDYNKTITINSLGSTENGIEIDLAKGEVTLSTNNIISATDGRNEVEIYSRNGTTGAVTYIYENGESYFEFELLTNRYTRSFTVTFDDLTGENLVKTVYANVNSGIYVSFPAGSEGYSASNPLESENIDSNSSYSSPNGSSITITGNSATDSEYRQYTIGGLSIITSTTDSSLEFEFSSADSIYVNNLQGENTSFTISGDDIDAPENNEMPINFVHSAQNKDIAVTIRIKAGYDYYKEGGVNQTITFYIRIAQTYQGLQAGYLINSNYSLASEQYENIARNSPIKDLVKNLLVDETNIRNDVYNNGKFANDRRVYLLDLDLDEDGNRRVALTDEMIRNIGFKDRDNPNYLSFSAGNYSNVVANEADSDLFDLNILSPTNNTLSQLVISNKTGVNTTYTYQIISADSTIGIDPTIDSAGYINKTEDTTETTTRTDYATLLINDEISADKSTNEILLLEETEIGSLRDGRNLDFFITSAGYKFDTLKDSESQYSLFTEVEKSAFDDTYGTTYTFTYSGSTTNPDGTTLNGNYKVSLRLGLNNRIYISASKSNINPFDVLNMTFTIYGTGGQISTTYNIILYNYTISSDYETASKSIYATQPINLLKDITFDSNSQSTSPAHDTDSALSLKDVSIVTDGRSYYNIGGTQRVTITSLTDNGIFRYNESSHLINTNAVPRDTTVVLTIEVKDSYGYIVKVMEYHFTLLVNFEFVVNGETLSGNSAFTTNYILTTSNLDATNQNKQFPYSMKYNSTNEYITTIKYNNQDYYYALQLLLRNKINGEPLDISSVTIREISDFGVTIDEDNQKIILNKDITGRIILQLTLNTGNGDYSVNWNIDVLGFVTMEYRYNLGANTIITQSNGEGFTSNSSVDLANSLQTASSSGLRMTNTSGDLTENGSITNDLKSADIELNVRYMILPFNEYENNFNASSLFNVGSSQIASATLLFDNNIIKTTLPSVAQSTQSAREYYLVIYQVNVEYFGQVNGPYYVTYKVYNNQSVTAESDSSVNVDTSLYKNGNNQYLDLFYYMVTYETDDGTFTQYVEYNNDSGTNVVVLENGNRKYINTDSNTQYIINRNESGGGTITINPDSESSEEYTINSSTTSGRYEGGNIKSLFTSQFNSIVEFATFINNISTIRFSNFNENGLAAESNENGYVEIELSYIGDGRFGILLYNGTNAPLKFNNQLTADLSVISNSGESEVTISAYSNGEGFRLYGDSELRANTTDITLGSIFLASELFSVESGFTLSEGMTEQIIGVVAGDGKLEDPTLVAAGTNWISSSGVSDINRTHIATFNVNGVEYYLNLVTFRSSIGDLYNLQADFYYIVTSTENAKIVTMDYSSTFQSYFYQVNPSYNYNTAGEIASFNDSVFNLAGKIKVYSMDNGKLVKNNFTPSSATEVIEQGAEEYTNITIANNIATITLADETLNELMLEGRQSITIDYTCVYDGYTLTFSIMFMIPTSGSPATPETT